MFFLLMIFLVCLFPIASYFLVLALINRRSRPLMISGSWDTLGLFLAASGILLGGVPGIMSLLFEQRNRDLPLGTKIQDVEGPVRDLVVEWFGLWLGYYLLVLAGAAFLLWWRRHKTLIYNVDPDRFEGLFLQILDRLGLAPELRFQRIILRQGVVNPEPVVSQPGSLNISASPFPFSGGPVVGELDIENFFAMSHVTLHWRYLEASLRTSIEAELQKSLVEARTLKNPAGGWFLAVSAVLFGFVFVFSLAVFLATILKAT